MDDRARFDEFARLATEQRNPRTFDLDRLDVPGILEHISDEDRSVPDAVRRELPFVAQAVELVVATFREGGRLIYVGAGTSGRLGVLDASECPPTFGADPERVNVNGGAVALGHPIGASGARILSTMIYELRRNGGGLGLAAICSGGGQGDALLIEV